MCNLKETPNRSVLIIYVVTFLVVLPYLLHNVKHSLYYRAPCNESVALRYHQYENNMRLNASMKALSEFKENTLSKASKQLKYDVLVSIITTSRNRHIGDGYKPHYLTQVTQTFLKEIIKLDDKEFHVGILICNVDSDPAFYDEAKYLNKFVSVVDRYKQTHLSILHVLEKEKQDYVFCLNNSFSQYNARYHFLVEDDTLPKERMMEVLQFTIARHLDITYRQGTVSNQSPEVLYVKFYHPERLLSYFSLEPIRLAELFGLSLSLSSVTVMILQHFSRAWRYYTLWTICTGYFILLLLSLGRVNVNDLREFFTPFLHTFSSSPSCCTPALLFPNRTILRVINHLNENTCARNFGKDSLLDQLVGKSKMNALIVEPNSFRHIGMYSALRNTVVHSSFV